MFKFWALWSILTFINLSINTAHSAENDVEYLPHYASDLAVNSDLEHQLKKKLAQKRKREERLHKLNEHIAKDTEYFDEIPHFAVSSSKSIRKQASIENAFKKIIGMVGVKYTYKRDLDWRTWREVTYPGKKKEIICYRCQNIVKLAENNCTSCHMGGYWVIEENQPKCSYEILSFRNRNEVCVAHFWQLNTAKHNSCPVVIPLNEIFGCGIPMITKYVVNADYSKNVSERTLPTFCKTREMCEFSTVYAINPESIVFRVINTTNDIIYSRIMKRNRKKYVCIDNCGIFNFDTLSATRKEDHLVLNLLNSNKKKRDNPRPKNKNKRQKSKSGNLKSNKEALNNNDLFVYDSDYLEQPSDRQQSTTVNPSMCKQILLKELYRDLNDDNLT
ncbi:uncharacterized protein LOC125239377 [Leguminivora glycinivorella]|uniref:uncharacterized protein LOC125239377 n=1 Tax=Leguminivora glycinivorella TaxID=1035111 RepID=UPI00200CF819|nr:uncharacterized protein LOC125239377 [Leguminivora glycinivorella]